MADARSQLLDLAVDNGNGRGDDGDVAKHAHDVGVTDHERARLAETIRQSRAAVARLADGTYGTCVECGGAIPPARLRVRPEAERCVPCEAKREERRRPGRSWDEEA